MKSANQTYSVIPLIKMTLLSIGSRAGDQSNEGT